MKRKGGVAVVSTAEVPQKREGGKREGGVADERIELERSVCRSDDEGRRGGEWRACALGAAVREVRPPPVHLTDRDYTLV